MEIKNKYMHHSQYTDVFNSVIDTLNLGESHISRGLYTWTNKKAYNLTNKQAHPTLQKLDRILMSCDWESLFLLANGRKLVKNTWG